MFEKVGNYLGAVPVLGTIVGLGRIVKGMAQSIYSPTQRKLDKMMKEYAISKTEPDVQELNKLAEKFYGKGFTVERIQIPEKITDLLGTHQVEPIDKIDLLVHLQYQLRMNRRQKINQGLNELIPFWGTAALIKPPRRFKVLSDDYTRGKIDAEIHFAKILKKDRVVKLLNDNIPNWKVDVNTTLRLTDQIFRGVFIHWDEA